MPYMMRKIVEAFVDAGTFFEIGRHGAAADHHRPRPHRRSSASRSSRAIRSSSMAPGRRMCATSLSSHVDLAETFHLPVVHFVDCPGFAVGVKHEKAGDGEARRARDGGCLPGARAVVLDRDAQAFGLAGSAMMNPTRTNCAIAGRLAIGARCRWPVASRPRTSPNSKPCRSRTRVLAEIAPGGSVALAVPHGRGLLRRRNHRPARHAQTSRAIGRTWRSA